MASEKEIKNRINSIHDTMKITNAMYMMSSMKLRKARQKLENTEPFFYGLEHEISDVLYHFPHIRHLYFDNHMEDEREVIKRRGMIVLTGDKGMAGAFNNNVIKEALAKIEGMENCHIYAVGEIGRQYFISRGYPVETLFRYSINNPSIHRARVISEYILDLYNCEKLNEVYVIYTRLINSMKELVEVKQLLPLKTCDFIRKERIERKQYGDAEENGSRETDDPWYTIYPSPTAVLERLVYNYITGFLYGALVESFASEENARMLAMKFATDNAESILCELTARYHQIRQAAITQEITEVISGVKALKKNRQTR